MTTILATLGYTPEKVTFSIREESQVERVVVFFGSMANKATLRALQSLRLTCAALGFELEEKEIGTSYDFVAASRAIRAEVRATRGPMLFNTSGGTGVMQAAATFVCYTEGVPIAYYNMEERRYVRMPRVTLTTTHSVSAQQQRVLQALFSAPNGLRPGELAKSVKIPDSNLDYHVKKLRTTGLVESVQESGPSGRHRLVATELARLVHE